MALKLLQSLRPINPGSALHDILAGVTLAAVNIPQVLGYTRIAGTPVVTGLYTAFLPLLAFTLLGSSRHLVVAADSATAAIFFGSLSHMAPPATPPYMALVCTLALLTAMLLLAARIFRLGFLADFLSRTVLAGFLTGVGIQVAIAMLGDMLGLTMHTRHTLPQLWQVAANLHNIYSPALELSLAVIAAILIGKFLAPRLPVALLAVIAATIASAVFHFAQHGIVVIGPVPGGLPRLTWPATSWSQTLALLPIAGSCAVMIIAQSAATSRGFAERFNERGDEDADILGLAAANAVAAFSSTFVVNGSPTQTATAVRAGARSQIAQQTFAAIVLVVLLFLTGMLQYLPRCVLASIVFTIGIGMLDLPTLREIRAESPGEFSLALLTAMAVVAIGVEQGILLAIALSLFRHVRHSYRPYTMVLAPGGTGQFVPVPARPGQQTEPGLIIYRFGADLFYANANHFADEVRSLIQQAPVPVRHFIVDAGAITDIDFSAARTLKTLLEEQARYGIDFAFARVSPGLRADLTRHRLTAIIGAGHLFDTLHEAIATIR